MNVLVLYHLDCGRMGEIESLFVTTKAKLEAAVGKTVYFGEVLGKHSEIDAEFSPEDYEIMSEDQEFIAKYQQVMGDVDCVGHNPLACINDDEDED